MSRTRRDHSWSKRWWIGIKESALGRDKKPGAKPTSIFKKLARRKRRHQIKQAMREGKEPPRFKKCDIWNWN